MFDDLDPKQLLLARLWVARLGEGDVWGWWRTDGVLGSDGAFVGPRVLPRTHATGRARIAFAVARHACDQRHPDPTALHLFRLTPEAEDRFDACLALHLADGAFWGPVITKLEAIKKGAAIGTTLRENGIVTAADLEAVAGLKLGPAGRSLAVAPSSTDATIRTLAAGFTRSEQGAMAVPYVEHRGD